MKKCECVCVCDVTCNFAIWFCKQLWTWIFEDNGRSTASMLTSIFRAASLNLSWNFFQNKNRHKIITVKHIHCSIAWSVWLFILNYIQYFSFFMMKMKYWVYFQYDMCWRSSMISIFIHFEVYKNVHFTLSSWWIHRTNYWSKCYHLCTYTGNLLLSHSFASMHIDPMCFVSAMITYYFSWIFSPMCTSTCETDR